MTRQEFIITLRDGLKKLPPEEIVAATEFYEEYFDEVLESGEKTEEEILDELGSPKRIAAQIRADYAARLLDGDETLLGEKPTTKKKLSAAWWVIIGIVSAPVSIPLAICAFWVVFGAACAAVGLAAGIIGSAVAGIGCVVFGAVAMADAVSSGIMITGIGLIVLAASAAAGVGLFIGVRAAVIAIAKAIRRGREKHRIRKLAEDKSAKEDWVYVNRPDEDEEAFIREMEAEAAEAEAEKMLLTGGEGNE
ncbi:MAG: DUF1700 domain-containing protein [Clostridiales bacterium]|nr:DUF1700 domain-containing protein [Clostridiales bacterium]